MEDKEKILLEIKEDHMRKHLRKYADRIVCSAMDEEDLQQVFLIECARAIDEADPTIGDPLMYVIQRGKWAVGNVLRDTYKKEYRFYCRECGGITRPSTTAGFRECGNCQEAIDPLIDAFRRHESIDENPLDLSRSDSMEDRVVDDSLISAFEEGLTGRKADVFRLIYREGYDRESCRNYIKEVAGALGITTANVSKRLRQIKKEWLSYKEELMI